MNDFTCDKCCKTFDKSWSEEAAEKEFANASYNIPGDARAVLCDDCFKEFQEWFSKLNPDDHKRIRK